jgi:tol-pal system protein YbgF
MRNTSILTSAAFAALFLNAAVIAAVPVEESVEEPVGAAARVNRAADATSRGAIRPLVKSNSSRRSQPLGIPPTIEPDQAPSITLEPSSNTAGSVGNSGGNSGRGIADLFYQIQILQQEIQDLRGQAEEQAYTIKRLQQDQKDQYLDLDRRVAQISQGAPAASAKPITGTTSSTQNFSGSPTNEKDAYRQAFEAMRGEQFEVSKTAFQALIANYPNGQYTPNAFYWIGEIFLFADQDPEQARQAFMQVVNLYPDHQKTPDALYKLGVVHATLAENDTARRFLDRVQREYPDASAAGLARKYAAELP